MKKLLLLIALLMLSLIATAQKDNEKLSNYEKYLLAKEQTQDTIYKVDTVFVDPKAEKPEYDDLYYTPSKDELKRKAKDIRLEKRKIRIQQDSAYYDAEQEVCNDLFDYSDYRFRLYFGYHPFYNSFYYSYWDPFYYDSFYWDSWFWGWHSPFYFGYYPFWYGHHDYWREWNHTRPYYDHNRPLRYASDNHLNVPYSRRSTYSNYSNNTRTSVIVNKTIQVDRRSGQIISPNKRNNYMPSYSQSRPTVRPKYNNSNPQQRSMAPTVRRSIAPTQSRTVQSKTYSTPNRSSNYSTPNRSYSPPSRSSSNYNVGSGMSRSSGGSFSGGSSRSSSSSSGSSIHIGRR